VNPKAAAQAIPAMALAVGLLWADGSWKQKPYTQWTVAEVNEVLANSPWVRHDEFIVSVKQGTVAPAPDPKRQADTANRPHSVQELRQRGNSSQESSVNLARAVLYFEWSSSLTVRQAVLRRMQLQRKANGSMPQQLLDRQPAHYVITVYGSAMSLFADSSEEALRQHSYLELKGSRRMVPAAKAEPVRLGLLLTAIRFYFARETEGKPTILIEEKKVKFVYKPEHGVIGMEFDLREMLRNAKPDL